MILDSMDYLPFGEQIAGGSTTSHKFTGYERDSESNLDFANARHYTSSFGRFMQPDPMGMFAADASTPQSWNFYAYAINNSVNFIDPTGLYCVDNNGQMLNPWNGKPASGESGGQSVCEANGGVWVSVGPDNQPSDHQSITVFSSNAGVSDALSDLLFRNPNTDRLRYKAKWAGTLLRSFGNGILHGVRQPGESFGACVARNADETTGGVASRVNNGAVAATAAIAGSFGALSQIPSPWANSASTIANVVGQMTGQTPNPITLTLAGTLGGLAAKSLGAGFGTTRLAIAGTSATSEAAAYGVTAFVGAYVGLYAGSAINCR